MPHFRPGVRVIKIAGKFKGMTGTVVGTDFVRGGTTQHPLFAPTCYITSNSDLQIQCDEPWINMKGRVFPPSITLFCQRKFWHPIEPDSYDKSTWDTKLWSPEYIKEIETT